LWKGTSFFKFLDFAYCYFKFLELWSHPSTHYTFKPDGADQMAQQIQTNQIVTWKKNGLRLRVLDRVGGQFNEASFVVCKETAPKPAMARFSVRVDETEAA